MAIKLAPVAQVEQEVTVHEPKGKGKFTPHKLLVTYKLHSASEMQAFYEMDNEERDTDDEIMHRDVLDVKGVKDDNGKDIEFSDDVLSALLDVTYIRQPIIEGWGATQSNRAVKAEKNS